MVRKNEKEGWNKNYALGAYKIKRKKRKGAWSIPIL